MQLWTRKQWKVLQRMRQTGTFCRLDLQLWTGEQWKVLQQLRKPTSIKMKIEGTCEKAGVLFSVLSRRDAPDSCWKNYPESGASHRGRAEKTMGHMSLRAGKKFIFSEGGACVLFFTVIKSFE